MGSSQSTPAARPSPLPRQPPALPTSPTSPSIDATTILSLLSVLTLLIGAYAASLKLLPPASTRKTRALFVWHAFDALIHVVFEGSFLIQCFCVYYSLPTSFATQRGRPVVTPLLLTPPDVHFLGRGERLYGAAYGTNVFARLWQEYAKADRRWGGVDLGVVSLELLTVGVGAPLAAWVCVLLCRPEGRGGLGKWWWMSVLATGELYGGWMTFAPEWLTGSPNLDTSNWMYLWVYLFFFNTLWVWFPLWVLYESYTAINGAMSQAEMVDLVNYLGKKDD
ncbi:Emopamil-binding protein [Lophium mytilinum]|uniref:Emopamil-binding protein n=1 Tax=Lophium mytilinum TaxID=390894 RepID=A0A6A6QYY8_9PEZI|nr:Emopamil-binding protein [Lophium mytilinum]